MVLDDLIKFSDEVKIVNFILENVAIKQANLNRKYIMCKLLKSRFGNNNDV